MTEDKAITSSGRVKKRGVEDSEKEQLPLVSSSKRLDAVNSSNKNVQKQEGEEFEFEDPYGDDYDEEAGPSDTDYQQDEEEEEKPEEKSATKIWVPGVVPMKPDEKLEYDPKCYEMLHSMMLDWSCLTFDIIPDSLGMNRSSYPHTAYIVAGTQADTSERNSVFVMKWSALHKTNRDSTEESDESDDEDNASEEDAKLDFNAISHKGTVNRIRCCPQLTRLVATWSETGKVHIWDISEHLQRLDSPKKFCSSKPPPLFTTHSHSTEGYAMDWNPLKTGRLLTGDCNANLFVWERIEGGWIVDSESPFLGHQKSVEDVQWKRVGAGMGDVFATACVDQALRVYDCRVTNRLPTQAIVAAHPSDINVLSWNPFKETLLLTGDDDGCCKVWDLRFPEMPVAKMHWHKEPISSVGWNPADEASFACSSYDDSVTFWDLSVEGDNDFEVATPHEDSPYPDQLMFHHMGQQQISELHWHSQIPGVVITTSVDGFNIFKTCNI
ncbi:WD domain, G-beta repeat-containing protein [Cardiosporidium cionae]|uniref:WD domain, G-beta repeat-containing protein n=1 Tax=Cardiosporidium cionae TaxID=476202 RepID=A0ABQ7JDR3_9APIC|nr:WD domain, G-beta repeat-containing protein [Cardiosporidium cionae]|eukprot:KAF8822157.1 WD domain, G-beta repeat-containing protein [Cardiosporidium cionae]